MPGVGAQRTATALNHLILRVCIAQDQRAPPKAKGNAFVCQIKTREDLRLSCSIVLKSTPLRITKIEADKLTLARCICAVQMKSWYSTGGEIEFTAGVEFCPITRS
jgi:hypothetical protein